MNCPMKVITAAQNAANAAKGLRDLITTRKRVGAIVYEWMEPRLQALEELGPSPSPEDVDRVIGGQHCTKVRCGHCGRYSSKVIEIGSSNFDEYGPESYCKSCIGEAARKLGV